MTLKGLVVDLRWSHAIVLIGVDENSDVFIYYDKSSYFIKIDLLL